MTKALKVILSDLKQEQYVIPRNELKKKSVVWFYDHLSLKELSPEEYKRIDRIYKKIEPSIMEYLTKCTDEHKRHQDICTLIDRITENLKEYRQRRLTNQNDMGREI